MAQRISKYIKLSTTIILLIMIFACSAESQNTVEKSSQSSANSKENNESIRELPPDVPSFPYIFHGKFYINGKLGPEGSNIFARLGNLDSPIIQTSEGEFENLIIGPKNKDDINNDVKFFLILEQTSP